MICGTSDGFSPVTKHQFLGYAVSLMLFVVSLGHPRTAGAVTYFSAAPFRAPLSPPFRCCMSRCRFSSRLPPCCWLPESGRIARSVTRTNMSARRWSTATVHAYVGLRHVHPHAPDAHASHTCRRVHADGDETIRIAAWACQNRSAAAGPRASARAMPSRAMHRSLSRFPSRRLDVLQRSPACPSRRRRRGGECRQVDVLHALRR